MIKCKSKNKIFLNLFFIILLLFGALGYSQSKRSDLMKDIGISTQSQLITEKIFSIYKEIIPNIPENVWTEIENEIDTSRFSKEVETLINLYYSDDEIVELEEKDIKIERMKPDFLNDLKKVAENFGKYIAMTVKASLVKQGYNW